MSPIRADYLSQSIQEKEYDYPYHYIPSWGRDSFSQVRYWSWGFRYIGGLQVAMDFLRPGEIGSLVDIGCGDGRFLREISNRFPEVRILGVDYSERAINMASALNPEIEFLVHDLTKDPLQRQFQFATLIEVLEHILPEKLPDFIARSVELIQPDGRLIVTVPHKNKPLSSKHFQHFDSGTLSSYLDPYFDSVELRYFDSQSRFLRFLQSILGGAGDHYLITNRAIMSAFFRLYLQRYLYVDDESSCGRIAAFCRL